MEGRMIIMLACLPLVLFMQTGVVFSETDPGSSSGEQPPLIFPDDARRYNILPNNSSMIQVLTHHANGSASEVKDLLTATLPLEQSHEDAANNNLKGLAFLPPHQHLNPKLETELLQRPGAEVDKDSRRTHQKKQADAPHSASSWAAIAAGTFLLTTVAAFIGMVVWRRSIESRYSSRQLLVNSVDHLSV